MKKVLKFFKKILMFAYKMFPIIGGYSIEDADKLMKDPDKYNYRNNSWFKKSDDILFKK
ncbi:MAG: hypothetical protein PHY47_03045 [Lachnospiraceae bacterium]|nr:hypothetical protein [Lachnospiraceae bacterium]